MIEKQLFLAKKYISKSRKNKCLINCLINSLINSENFKIDQKSYVMRRFLAINKIRSLGIIQRFIIALNKYFLNRETNLKLEEVKLIQTL